MTGIRARHVLQAARPEGWPAEHAIRIAGSMERLADFLCRPLSELHAWARGLRIPQPAFMTLVDIVSANALTAGALDNLEARARADIF